MTNAAIRIALAGNPNCGKTSIFNHLTGGSQHVGNYPGVTVDRREGAFAAGDQRCEVVDLPGTYSLASHSPEERIAQRELVERGFDVVAAVVDSTALGRSLVLVTQLMQLGVNPVLVLNMADEADAGGLQLDVARMSALLGVPVVRTVGHRGHGIGELRRVLVAAARAPRADGRLVLGERLERALAAIAVELPSALPARVRGWVATRLLVGDTALDGLVHGRRLELAAARKRAELERAALEADTGEDATLFVMQRYYGFVDGLLRQVVLAPPREDARAVSNRIDSVLAHPVLGLPAFLAVMFGIFWLTFRVGEVPMQWIEAGTEWLGGLVGGLWPAASPSPLRSLLVDGVIAGVGGVVVFLPNIVLLFLGLALVEDTGYMARAAFLMDRVMHRFGLHGRSFIPMMSGFGCSIPGIMATRTLEHEHDRLATMLVLPLMSCGARLPIWMLLIPAFFAPAWRAPMLWAIYVIGVALALVLALVLRRTALRGDEAPFVMELPPYRLPTLRAVVRKMVERSSSYLRKAGTIILGVSIVMWCITAYPVKPRYDVDAARAAGHVQVITEDGGSAAPAPPGVEPITASQLANRRAAEALRYSLAGRIGGALEPVLAPLGFDWKIGTALIGAFAAKEVFVAQMGIIYAMGETDEGSSDLQATLRRDYSPVVGVSLMLFLLIATPCMATVAVMRRESGGWKWPLVQFGGLTAIAYLLSLLVYQLGRLLA